MSEECQNCAGRPIVGCDDCLHTGKAFPFFSRQCIDEPCCVAGEACPRRVALLTRTCLARKDFVTLGDAASREELCGKKASYVICGEPFCADCEPAIKRSYAGADEAT
jgi:hypothetical protein